MKIKIINLSTGEYYPNGNSVTFDRIYWWESLQSYSLVRSFSGQQASPDIWTAFDVSDITDFRSKVRYWVKTEHIVIEFCVGDKFRIDNVIREHELNPVNSLKTTLEIAFLL